MIVKSFGCSFTWGSELPDSIHGLYSVPSKLTWPALVADHLNCDYDCFAWPGVGNFYIANSILDQCTKSQESNDFFIINWTYLDRFDYLPAINDSCRNLTLPWKWRTCRPGEDEARDFFKKYHSETRSKLESLQLIKLCVDSLLQLNVRFVMSSIDNMLLEHTLVDSPSIKFLQDCIQPHITKFDGMNFLEYADTRKHARSHGGHLNEHAHSDIAQYVISSLNIQNTVDC